MKNFLTLLVVWFCILTVVSSCKKSGMAPKKPTDSTQTGTTGTTGTPGTTDVYIAGYEIAAGSRTAVYWKNGTEVKLPSGVSTNCVANAICVSGNDVYVAGASGSQAVYWKNGKLIGLPSGLDTLQATSITVANSNVYVGISQPTLYEAQKTRPGGYVVVSSTGHQTVYGIGNSQQQEQTGIYVSGTDVYNSGSYAIKGGIEFSVEYYLPEASYWKNGTQVLLPFAFDFSYYYSVYSRVLFSAAYGIAVSGNTVYTVGAVGFSPPNDNTGGNAYPAYWENGTAYMLGEEKINGVPQFPLGAASCISLSGSDVYIGGTVYENTNDAACYWKNGGAAVFMPRQGDYAEGNAIAVSGSDVYMAGTDFNDNPQETYKACYWKNGNEITLANADASTLTQGLGMFIVKH